MDSMWTSFLENYSNEINQSDDNQNELNELYEKLLLPKVIYYYLEVELMNNIYIYPINQCLFVVLCG